VMSDDEFYDGSSGFYSGDEFEFDASDGEDPFAEEDFDAPPLERQRSYAAVEEDEILTKAKQEIAHIIEVLGIPSQSLAVILLRYFKWNKEKLITSYTEDQVKTCKECGIRPDLKLEKKPKMPKKKFCCTVCLEEYRCSKGYALGCGHRFCTACWKRYLEINIRDGISCLSVVCMAKKCKNIVHEEAVKKTVSPAFFERYTRFMLRSYVEDNDKVKWCPAPNCGNCVKSDRNSRKEPVTCLCGFTFCFQCADFQIGDHSPAGCSIVEKWRQKSKDESENVNWMIANTKKCPKCRAPIEKNGGCMHIVCKKNFGGCGHEFCWLCRGNWSDHGTHTGGYYNCNKYENSTAKKEDMSAEDVKTELDLYMFYYHRYESHLAAGKIAQSQREEAEQRAVDFQTKFQVRSEDTKFLTEATEQLLRNRRVLQYSYVIGYYLNQAKSPERNLFEFVQEDLEKYTNRLSELYEHTSISIEDYQAFMDWKLAVTDFTRICDNFLTKFSEGVSQGLTTDSLLM